MSNKMNILILVLSCQEPPYDKLYEAQRRTWDNVKVERVGTKYYFPTSFETMFQDFQIMLDKVWDESWDMIFRTNSSSYIDKQVLQQFAKTLPLQKCYCGINGGGFASGSGMFLSRDVVNKIRQERLETRLNQVEDEEIGTILHGQSIYVTPGAKRYDFYFEEFQKKFYGRIRKDFKEHYHYRCKSDTEDRMKDVEAMEIIHEWKTA